MLTTSMKMFTVNTLDDQMITVLTDSVCSIEENRDSVGCRITLSNGRDYQVQETMIEIVSMMQAPDLP